MQGEVDSKLMAALLTGVKRAFPYTQSELAGDGPLSSHVDALFKLVHMVRFGLAIQVLCILDQVVGNGKGNSDRYFVISIVFSQLTVHFSFLSFFFAKVLFRFIP